jgi:hypothetical protein
MFVLLEMNDLLNLFKTPVYAKSLIYFTEVEEVSCSDLQRKMGIARRQAHYVMKYLLSTGLVHHTKRGRYRLDPGLRQDQKLKFNFRDSKLRSLFLKGVREILLELYLNGPTLSERDLARATDLPQPTIHRICKKLRASDMITHNYEINPTKILVCNDCLEGLPKQELAEAMLCFRDAYELHSTNTIALIASGDLTWNSMKKINSFRVTAIVPKVQPREFTQVAWQMTRALRDAARTTTSKHGIIVELALCSIESVWSYLWGFARVNHLLVKDMMWGITIAGRRLKRDLREYTHSLFQFSAPTDIEREEWLQRKTVVDIDGDLVITRKGLLRSRRSAPEKTVIREMIVDGKKIDIICTESIAKTHGSCSMDLAT